MSKADSLSECISLPDNVAKSFSVLQARSRTLKRFSWGSFLTTTVAAVAVAAELLLWPSPDATLHEVDLPKEVTYLFSTEKQPDNRESPRQAFTARIRNKGADYLTVDEILKYVTAPEAVRSYVVAQYILNKIQQAGEPLSPADRKLLQQYVSKVNNGRDTSFSPLPQAAYAIDVAAYGEPHHPSAVTYLAEIQHRQSVAQTGRVVLLALALLTGLTGSGALLLSQLIRRRLDRIRPLIITTGKAG